MTTHHYCLSWACYYFYVEHKLMEYVVNGCHRPWWCLSDEIFNMSNIEPRFETNIIILIAYCNAAAATRQQIGHKTRLCIHKNQRYWQIRCFPLWISATTKYSERFHGSLEHNDGYHHACQYQHRLEHHMRLILSSCYHCCPFLPFLITSTFRTKGINEWSLFCLVLIVEWGPEFVDPVTQTT
jgi:hypothetical protein